LTAPSTAFNIVGGIGLLLLIVWGGLSIWDWVKNKPEEETEDDVKSKTE
jgi:hypothetical protein